MENSSPPLDKPGDLGSQPRTACLYIGDLAPHVTEVTLKTVVDVVAPSLTIKVCRNMSTNESLGYAFVNFWEMADAERVMQALNYTRIEGKECRIMWAQTDAGHRKSTEGNVFVSNIDQTVETRELFTRFSEFGKVVSCKIVAHQHSSRKNHGYVQFENHTSAETAVTHFKELGGPFTVEFFRKTIPGDPESISTQPFSDVYIKYVPKSWSEETLRSFVKELGGSGSFNSRFDGEGRISAFVSFSDPIEANAVVECLHRRHVSDIEIWVSEVGINSSLRDGMTRFGEEHPVALDTEAVGTSGGGKLVEYDETRFYVQKAMSKAERQVINKNKYGTTSLYPGVNLFIKNLPEKTTKKDLEEMFSVFGRVISVSVRRASRTNLGHVSMMEEENAKTAVSKLDGSPLEGQILRVCLHEQSTERTNSSENEARPSTGYPYQGFRGNELAAQLPRQGYYPPVDYSYPNQKQFLYHPPVHGASQEWARLGYGYLPQNENLMMQGISMPPMHGNAGPYSGPQQAGSIMNHAMAHQPTYASGMMQHQKPSYHHQMMKTQSQNYQQASVGTPSTAANSPSPVNIKQELGECLYPLVVSVDSENAGKITGMILEMPPLMVTELLNDSILLSAKIKEAQRVLRCE